MPVAQKKTLQQNITAATSTIGTMCSGSGMAEVVHDMVLRSLGKQTGLRYSCECVPFKRQYLHTVVHKAAQSACCFADMMELSSGFGTRAVHTERTKRHVP